MNRSSYRGEHKGSTIKARSKIYASRTFRLVLAVVLAVGLMPGLSYAVSALDVQPSDDNEALVATSERATEPAEEQSDANEGDQQQEGQQPDQQQEDQQEGQQPDQQLDQKQEGQQPEQQPDQQGVQQREGQQPDQQDGQQQGQQFGGEDQINADPALTAMNADADTTPAIGTAGTSNATVEIVYSSTPGTESAAIDGETRSVKTFTTAPTMTVTVSGVDGYFVRNQSRIRITNVLTNTVLTELWGENTWKNLDGSDTGRFQATYQVNADGRYKVEVSLNGELAQTDYIDVDLIGPQVEVKFNNARTGADETNKVDYFNAETTVTVTVKDRHLNISGTAKPTVSSPSNVSTLNDFFGAWNQQTTDSDGNLVYTSTSSSFAENYLAIGAKFKFGVTAKDAANHETAYQYGDNAEATGTTGAKSTKDSAGTELKGANGFVVDTTRPTVAVKFDKVVRHPESGDNGTDYFTELSIGSDVVTATIVVTDNNFNKDDPNNKVNITKADDTNITTEGWFEDTNNGNQDYKPGQWTYKINFPESKPGEKFSFSFTATDWAGLTTEYKYGCNKEKSDTAGATSTVDDADPANKLNGENFVVDGRHPNVNVTMGGARVQKASTNDIDAFNVNTVTIAVDDGSFNAAATGKPKFMVLSGSTETATETGIEFGEWASDAMTVKLPDSKKGESYKFTLTAKDMISGETAYKYGDNNDEETSTQSGYNVKIGRARSTKDSTEATMTGGSFVIDTKGPQLDVSFDTVAANTAGEKTELTRYYDASAEKVVAKVSVFDIHLDTNDISVKVYESDGTTEASGCTVSPWADGDAEDTKVATVTIDKPETDKTYILKVTGKDQFTNQIESADPSTTYVEPAAGTADAYYQSKITFDSQAPKITVAWGDEATNGKYYNADREATITVTEANFDASRMQISQDGGSTWTTTDTSDWDGDGTYTYTGSLKDFTADGTYTLQVKGTDLVGNPLQAGAVSADGMSTQQATDADQAGSLQVASADPVDDGKPADTQQGSISDGTYASAEFVIDKTSPTATITWDNNNAHDDIYYDSPRTATITVTERNFRASDFTVETAGEVSDWSDDGDTHTCTVSFTTDGRYTLTVSGQDLAGNAMDAIAEAEFVIDLTEPDVDPVEPDVDPVEPDVDPEEPDADPVEPADDPEEPATDPVVPAIDHHDKGNSVAKGTTGTRTAHQAGTLTPQLGDSLFESSVLLVALSALSAVIALAALLASRRKGRETDGKGAARG